MGYGIKLKVFGDYACFTRPEMKAERVSYDVITPSAARGIIEAIHWKPAIRWVIDRIYVLNEIQFTNIRRNEVNGKVPAATVQSIMKMEKDETAKPLYINSNSNANRQQRAAMVLKNVHYVIEAHFELTDLATEDDTVEKHYSIALRRAKSGQCFNQPYFGTREFPANFELFVDDSPLSDGFYYKRGETVDLGWVLWDIDFANANRPLFYRAIMSSGVIDVSEPMLKG